MIWKPFEIEIVLKESDFIISRGETFLKVW